MGAATDVGQGSTGFRHNAHRNVAGNDREGHIELSMMEVNVRSANFRVERLEGCRARLQGRAWVFADLERLVRTGEDYGSGHFCL